MKYILILIVPFALCCTNAEQSNHDDIPIIIQATYDLLEQSLIGVPPPPPEYKWLNMDSIERIQYIELWKAKERRIHNKTCFMTTELSHREHSVRSEGYGQVYNPIIMANLRSDISPQGIVEIVYPGSNSDLTACPDRYRIPKPPYLDKNSNGQFIPEHIMVFSSVYFDESRERAIILAGWLSNGRHGERGLFMFQKLDGNWTMIKYEA